VEALLEAVKLTFVPVVTEHEGAHEKSAVRPLALGSGSASPFGTSINIDVATKVMRTAKALVDTGLLLLRVDDGMDEDVSAP
jgi:hypothetical protein